MSSCIHVVRLWSYLKLQRPKPHRSPLRDDVECDGEAYAVYKAGTHPALKTYDILCQIFEKLSSSPSSSDSHAEVAEKRRALALSARVCRDEPALRVLWRELDSLMPLLRLPSCRLEGRGRMRRRQYAHRSDWQRFTTYSQWVQRITHREHADVILQSALCTLIAEHGGCSPCPILHELRFTITSSVDIRSIMSFIHKTLQLLDVVVDSGVEFTFEDGVTPYHNLESLLLSLHFRCPELKSLRFRGFFGTSIIDCIGRLRNLQTLFLVRSGPAPILDAASLVKLSHVASLSQLELYAPFDKPELAPITFSSLKQLILRGQLSSIVNLLSTIAAPSLVLLSVSEAKCHSTQECQNVFRIAANRFGQSLRIIRSTISLYNSEEEGARVLNVLKSILDLHKIEEVHFHLLLWKSVIFGDDDVSIMARAWPWIRCLTVSYGSIFPMLPTARALGYLAAQCPNLTSVILPAIDFSEQGESNLHSANYNMKHLRIRCVAHARTEDEVERAAKFVYQLFPQIDTIMYHQDNTYPDGWTRIMKRYDELRATCTNTR